MHPACQTEEDLLEDCLVRRERRSGPGGQHRNKVETAVVVQHVPTGIQGEASERRSQEQNRRRAMFRLRVNLAIEYRDLERDGAPSRLWQERCRQGRLAINPDHSDFPSLLAEALDIIARCDTDVRAASQRLGCTPSQLIKLVRADHRALQLVNQQRQARELPPLR